MQEKRQSVLRLPFSYSGPGPSLRGWNACRGGRNDALSPSPDMDRESAYGAETLDRMPSVIPFTIPGCCPDGRGLWHGRLGIEPTTSDFGDRLASLGTFSPMFVCLSRLSPLRVGCLRLAPIGTRFCCPAAPISGQPVCECTSHGAGCGADGRT